MKKNYRSFMSRYFMLLFFLLSSVNMLQAKSLEKILKNYQSSYLNDTDYPQSPEHLYDIQRISARCFQKIVLHSRQSKREESLLELVEIIKSSPLTPIFSPIVNNLQKGVKFQLLHRPKSTYFSQLQSKLKEIQKAIRADTLIGGYPSNTSLKISKGVLWTTTNRVNLDIKASSPKDRVVEMAFSEDGVVYKPFQTFQAVVSEFPLSDVEGHKKLWVIFRTDRGLIGGVAFDSIDYDKTPPIGDFIVNNGESTVNKHKITLHLTVKDAFPEDILMQVKVSEGEENPRYIRFRNTLQTYLLGISGPKEVSVRFKDRFNQISTPIKKLIYLNLGY
ncbi:hypothetical protein ACFL35_20605 [Candidatus Riflebacteria bacterium]